MKEKIYIKFFFKIKLHIIIIMFDIFSAQFLLHNLIFDREEVNVEKLMQMIEMEVLTQDVNYVLNGLNCSENNVWI